MGTDGGFQGRGCSEGLPEGKGAPRRGQTAAGAAGGIAGLRSLPRSSFPAEMDWNRITAPAPRCPTLASSIPRNPHVDLSAISSAPRSPLASFPEIINPEGTIHRVLGLCLGSLGACPAPCAPLLPSPTSAGILAEPPARAVTPAHSTLTTAQRHPPKHNPMDTSGGDGSIPQRGRAGDPLGSTAWDPLGSGDGLHWGRCALGPVTGVTCPQQTPLLSSRCSLPVPSSPLLSPSCCHLRCCRAAELLAWDPAASPAPNLGSITPKQPNEQLWRGGALHPGFQPPSPSSSKAAPGWRCRERLKSFNAPIQDPTHLRRAQGLDPTNIFPPTNASGPQAVRGDPRGTPGLIPLCTLQEWADVCCRGLRSVHAYILVYDICCFDSFEYIKTIRQQILETR